MTTITAAAVRMFNQVHRGFGSPTLRIIGPISTWTLPAGATYNAALDQFEDGEGDVVAVSYAAQPSITVGYVPVAQTYEPAAYLDSPRAVDEPGFRIFVKYSSATDTALDDFWAILLNGELYRIDDRTQREYLPMGIAAPALIRMALRGDIKTYA